MRHLSFQRALKFGPRAGRRRLALGVLSLLVTGSLLLVLLLLYALLDLLVTGGTLRVAAAEFEQLKEWAGMPSQWGDGAPAAKPAPQLGAQIVYQERGLLPLVYRHGGAEGTGPLGWLYRRVPWLQSSMPCLAALLAAAAAAMAVGCLAWRVVHRYAVLQAERTATSFRHEVYRHAFHLGGSDISPRKETLAVKLFTETIEQLRRGLAAWWNVVPLAPLAMAVLAAVALAAHVWVTLAAMLLAVLLFLLGSWMAQPLREHRIVLASRAAQQMALLVESLQQVRLVSGYLLDDHPGTSLAESMRRYAKAAREQHLAETAGRYPALLGVLIACGLVVGLAGVNILHTPPRLSLAAFGLLAASLACIYPMLGSLLRLRPEVAEADRAAALIFEYLEREPGVGQPPGAMHLGPLRQELTLQEITLREPSGAKLLDDVTLRIAAGRRTALWTSEPATARALACLLPRFYDPHEGRVLYDGTPVQQVSLESLRAQVALVLQEGLLFTGSVYDNIVCGQRRFSEDDVRAAARSCRAYEFLQRLPQGFDTIIGEHGTWVDPGRRLLVGLCRAVLRKPSVLVVEEPLEELDPEMSAAIDAALAAVAAERTLFILARRLATLRASDVVYLLHEGKVHADGPHAELVRRSDLYRHLLYLQFNEFRGRGGALAVEA
jgi:ATP-binding cassette subfamily B protein